MAKIIIEIRNPSDDSDRRLIEYTTIMDAPTTYGMTRPQFRDWYQRQYADGDLDQRLGRVDERGHSTMADDPGWRSPLFCNRAGPDETCLVPAEIWHCYVTRAPDDPACWAHLPTQATLDEVRDPTAGDPTEDFDW